MRKFRAAEMLLEPRIVDIFSGIVEGKTTSHAFLLHGPPGTGKETLVRKTASILNCENPEEKNNGECSCSSCATMRRGNSPYLLTVRPELNQILIKQIRDLISALRLVPPPGKRRVILMKDASTMGAEAANSFLKILEEPPSDVLFFLITSSPEKLLPTIRSRCQNIRVNPSSALSIRNFLEKRFPKLDSKKIETIINISAGSPASACALAGIALSEPDTGEFAGKIFSKIEDLEKPLKYLQNIKYTDEADLLESLGEEYLEKAWKKIVWQILFLERAFFTSVFFFALDGKDPFTLTGWTVSYLDAFTRKFEEILASNSEKISKVLDSSLVRDYEEQATRRLKGKRNEAKYRIFQLFESLLHDIALIFNKIDGSLLNSDCVPELSSRTTSGLLSDTEPYFLMDELKKARRAVQANLDEKLVFENLYLAMNGGLRGRESNSWNTIQASR